MALLLSYLKFWFGVWVLSTGIAALDGVSTKPFVAEVTENAGTPVLLSLQHVAQMLGTVIICAVDIRLTHQT